MSLLRKDSHDTKDNYCEGRDLVTLKFRSTVRNVRAELTTVVFCKIFRKGLSRPFRYVLGFPLINALFIDFKMKSLCNGFESEIVT